MRNAKNALAALWALPLAACGGQEQAPAGNGGVEAEAAASENASAADPERAGVPADPVVEPAAPPPDAVSHPGGYLPPLPAEAEPAGSNSSSPGDSPATEDEYMRNKQ